MNADALLLDALIDSIVSGETVPPERFGTLASVERTRRLAEDLRVIATIAEVGRDSANLSDADRSARIGRFELGSPLGAGGMGTVWEARDTTLERTVAIKFLHPHLASDPRYRERFLREGRAVARLRHRGICAIYEVGETPEALTLTERGQVLELEPGTPFAAIELVRGVTLQSHLRRVVRLPEREVLRIATDAADALAAAHEIGIVHRDIKPANIMLGSDGRVVLLDFGLAGIDGPSELTEPRTHVESRERSSLTMAGDIVGTIAYMSPEQARGQKIDARTDVFSLGLVVWEMLTGTRIDADASAGRNTAISDRATRTEFLPDEPQVPKSWRRFLQRCVAADARSRYPSAKEILADLRARAESKRKALNWSLASGIAIAAMGASGWFFATRDNARLRPEPVQKQLTSNPPETAVNCAAISPDGEQLAFADPTGTYLRLIKTGETRRIVAKQTLDVFEIAWFPDGTRLVLTALTPDRQGESAWIVPVLGGTPRKLRDDALVGSISPDGSKLLFYNFVTNSPGSQNGIWVMDSDGDDARQVLPPPEGNNFYPAVTWAPDGKRILFIRREGSDGAHTAILGISDLTGAPPTVVLTDPELNPNSCAGSCAWLAPDRIFFTRNDPPPNESSANLWELRIDPTTSAAVGDPIRLTGLVDTCISGVKGNAGGTQLGFLRQRRQWDTYLGELQGRGSRLENVRRLSLDDRDDIVSGWTRDSRAIFFASNRQGTYDLFSQAVEGGAAEAIVQRMGTELGATLSPDGRFLLYLEKPPGPDSASFRVMKVPVDGGAPELVAQTAPNASLDCPTSVGAQCVLSESLERKPIFFALDPLTGKGREIGRIGRQINTWALSPDGTEIAFVGGELDHGREGITLRSMTVSDGAVHELDVPGVPLPQDLAWSPDGRSLFIVDLVAKGSSLGWRVVHADLAGHVQVLRHSNLVWQWLSSPLPSPDGRYLAFGQLEFQSNAWSLEGF